MRGTVRPRFGRIEYAARASAAIATQPREGLERTLERLAERRDRRRGPWGYRAVEACEDRLHQLIGVPWPCGEDGFEDVWDAAVGDLRTSGLEVGRGAFGGWDDADVRLGRFAWCLARHLRPERVVETGVARGVTSRLLLEALVRNGTGRLWSIDLPPLLERHLARETAVAVPRRLHDRWTLVRGSSRRVLPRLLAEIGRVDLFLHDSMHTTRNLRFELGQIWPALATGGVALIDDVEKNSATAEFLQARPATPAVICSSEDGAVLIGALMKRGP